MDCDCAKRPCLNRNSTIYMDLKDIIREHALQHLPAKSLYRFRGVCKEWRFQINSPFFVHKQSVSFRAISGLFCQSTRAAPKFVSLDLKSCGVPDPSLSFLPEPVDIRSSSNGLLCCHSRRGDGTYYICNPATQQWKKLPKSTVNHGSDPAIVVVFEPSLLDFTAEYKLFCVCCSNEFDDALEVDVYSSVEGSWKTSREISFSARSVFPRSGVLVNNVIYWKLKQGGLLAYDLMKDRLQTIQRFYCTNGTLGSIDGKLCSARVTGHRVKLLVLPNVHINMMAMNTRGSLSDRFVDLDNKVLGGDACEEVVMVADNMIVVKCRSKFYLADLKMKETKLLVDNPSSLGEWCVPYVNSLVSI